MLGLNVALPNGASVYNIKNHYRFCKQKSLVSTKLQTLRAIPPEIHSKGLTLTQPTLQYFLAKICDIRVNPEERTRLGLRYANTPGEVQKLLLKLKRKQSVAKELANVDLNAVITTLKEILSSFPRGIFDDQSEEFICVSPESSLETALIYVNGLILQLPHFLRQFTYLICRSIRNLIHQSAGSITDAYTDALLIFTPVLFSNSVQEIDRFLRAARITLILVDLCDFVFRPFLVLTSNFNPTDDDFFHDVLDSLTDLCNWLDAKIDNDDSNDNASLIMMESHFNLNSNAFDTTDDGILYTLKNLPNPINYYQITYLTE
ncbi:unnamed protein product [Thelazia callipaeda]|uniref:Rho-GAP domain-containing protein n=1 Tax=Thelazia callipaeda TaxID=103827 RepID=A0A0N5D438_THECL|nr:unnamed protein product [Thelazia callipaeda]